MEFPVPFFVTLTIPTNAGVGKARIVLDGVHGAILVYNNSPTGLGSLVYSLSFTNFTDPYGNQVKSLMNLGQWSSITGVMAAHMGVDANGNIYIGDTNGVTRVVVTGGAGGIWAGAPDPAIIFYNSFGATVLVVDPQRGGTFQYQDNNSAVQGGLIGAQVGKNTTDPIGGSLLSAGVNIVNPVFGDTTRVTGSIIVLNNLNWNNSAQIAASGGTPTGAVGPFTSFQSPFQNAPANNTVSLGLFGESPDQTIDAGLVVQKFVGRGTTTKLSNALLEVQGLISALMASSGLTAFFASVVGDAFSRFSIDSNGLMHWGTGAAAADCTFFREGVGILGTNSIIALQNQGAGTPASITGFTELYSDSFTQLHTDRAFQTDVNVETKNQASPPGIGGAGSKLYSTSGHMQSRSGSAGIGGDNNSYDTEKLTIVGAAVTVNQTTFAQTLLSHHVGIGTYRVKARLRYVENVAAGIPEFAFTGPATSDALLTAMFVGSGNQGAGGTTTVRGGAATGIGTANFVNGITMTGSNHTVDLELLVTFTAAGTLALVAATTVAADTFTVTADSEMTIEPVVAV